MLLLVLSLIFAFQANPDSLLRPRAALSFEFLKGNGNVEDTHFPMLSSDLPFWMHANQLGRVDPTSTIAYELRTTYSRNYGTRSRGTPGGQGVLPRPDRRLDEWMLGLDMIWSPELTRLHYTLGVASDLPGETWGFKVGLRIGELTP